MCFETGKPSVERCKKIRMKREEAQELAELDVNNIISTQGNMLYGGLMGREITHIVINQFISAWD